MVINKEILSDYKEVYEKAVKLVDEESQNDPVTDPFRSHNAAADLLVSLKDKLVRALACNNDEIVVDLDEDVHDDKYTYKIIIAWVCLSLGRIYSVTNEVSNEISESELNECIYILKYIKLKPEAVIPYMSAHNDLGKMHNKRCKFTEALNCLMISESIYNDFKAINEKALCLSDVFGTPDEIEKDKGTNELEAIYTMCTFYLAQVFGHLEKLEKSANYCFQTLERQLLFKTYEAIDFALNAATLSQYFIGHNKFQDGRHQLAAATLIITEYKKSMITENMNQEQKDALMETYNHRYADVGRCWAKYGLSLLSASKERLYIDDEQKMFEDTENLVISSPKIYRYSKLDVKKFEDGISHEYCLTFEDAKPVYHFIIKWLDRSKEYYKAETEASEYAKIIKDYAELYLYMAFFEEDPTNQIKMNKRRIKYFEELLELLNPTFYLSICRECWYYAGVTYCSILNIQLDNLKVIGKPTEQYIDKINRVCLKASEHFKSFISSYTDKGTGKLKPLTDAEEECTVLYAYFYLGRVYFKMMSSDFKEIIENLTKSLCYYKLFIKECDDRKEAAETLRGEVGVTREMINLLPFKIEKLKQKLN